MEQVELKRVIEGLLFVFSESLSVKRLKDILQDADDTAIRQAVEHLNAEYAAANRAFRIQDIAGGLHMVTDESLAPWIRKALQPPKPDSVTSATMETLAIIAYRQPITKAEIEAVRGVDATASLDTLVERQFVKMTGRKDTPGRPFLYGTTTEFLRHFGLTSIEALPKMATPTIQEPHAESAVATPSN
ncbi:MAG: SMC-Scp complex subunit ScpB [Candidatus Omnitrophica bacterium]|nr:SMC-Scp complex subunit ScpB [Candidatus Omnitrophota bacterium]